MLVEKFDITTIIEYNNIYILGKESGIIKDILYNIKSKYSIGYVYTTNTCFYNFIECDLLKTTLNIIPYKNHNSFLVIDNILLNENRISRKENVFFIFKSNLLSLYKNIDILFIYEFSDYNFNKLYKFLLNKKFDISYLSFKSTMSILLKNNECIVINLDKKTIYWYKSKNHEKFYIKHKLTILDKFNQFFTSLKLT